MSLEHEINQGNESRTHAWLSSLRARMHYHPVLRFVYRVIVIGLGGLFLLAGIIMLVTPGPGWLFIFLGLGLWGTEFTWAHRFNVWAKAKVLGIWYNIRTRREKRHRTKNRARWARRPNKHHYCPDASHYH